MIAVAVVLNGASRKRDFFYTSILPALTDNFTVSVFETQYAGHASELAAITCGGDFDYILAAGGDGTLNQVLNGLLLSGKFLTTKGLGLIPLGTGNDFARACGLRADPRQVISLIKTRAARLTDIGQLNSCDKAGKTRTIYFINCCSLGMGPEVVTRLLKSKRKFGPGFTYLRSIIETFIMQELPHVECQAAELKWEGKIRVIGIANGRSFGNAIYIAPEASLSDGLLDIFIAGNFSLLKFLSLLIQLKRKKKSSNPGIKYAQTKSIHLISPDACAIETEGELAGFLPATINILPSKILFLR